MKYNELYRWDFSPRDAILLQGRIRERIVIKKLDLRDIHFVAGVLSLGT
jgi:hypothetical protein